jgi:hypothetical protein
MEIEYRVVATSLELMEKTLNTLSEGGWSLHTVLKHPGIDGYGSYTLIMEGARAEEPEPEHRPMRMR